MKKVILTALFVAGLTFASCGSNKTEGDASGTATDTITSTTTTTTTDTVAPAATDTVAPSNDTVTPAP